MADLTSLSGAGDGRRRERVEELRMNGASHRLQPGHEAWSGSARQVGIGDACGGTPLYRGQGIPAGSPGERRPALSAGDFSQEREVRVGLQDGRRADLGRQHRVLRAGTITTTTLPTA